jgi:hypothetical protein
VNNFQKKNSFQIRAMHCLIWYEWGMIMSLSALSSLYLWLEIVGEFFGDTARWTPSFPWSTKSLS